MPIYEYQCTKCEHKMEALQKSFRLKGSGWYETDFKTGNKKQLVESEAAASSGSNAEKLAGEKSDSPPSKGDGKAAVSKEAAKNKGTDSKKTPSQASSR
jgi:predicted nucleic acid-binding Zn ribbon protein